MGFSVWSKPTPRPVNPLGGETINRRAVCGRTACTVRRGEGPKPIGPSYPYHDVVSPDWRDQAGRVRAVFRGVWRASSLVECVNSVARMQQARHRKMTPGLLDLKRLYWNLRRFRTGHRKNETPYGLLGLKLPDLSFWEFLKLTPEDLREQLSAQGDAA